METKIDWITLEFPNACVILCLQLYRADVSYSHFTGNKTESQNLSNLVEGHGDMWLQSTLIPETFSSTHTMPTLLGWF